MRYFLYLCLGKEKFLRECEVSIVSMYNIMPHKEEYQIILMTDTPEYFDSRKNIYNNLKVIEIDEDRKNKWTENGSYFYTAKIHAIQYFMELYKSDIIFLDTDTVIYENLMPLFDQIATYSLMNFRCRELNQFLEKVTSIPNFDDITNRRYERRILCYRHLKKGVTVSTGNIYKAGNECQLFNSGVIGIGYRHKGILEEVRNLTLELYYSSNYNPVEEVAFSVVLQQHGKILLADTYLVHYYECKNARLITGYLLKIINKDEERELMTFLNAYGIKDLTIYDIQLNECSAFMDFIRFYKGNYMGNNIEGICYKSDEKINTIEMLNKRCFRKWIRNENKAKKENYTSEKKEAIFNVSLAEQIKHVVN